MQNIILKIIFIKKKNTIDKKTKKQKLYYEIKIKIYKYIYKSNISIFM